MDQDRRLHHERMRAIQRAPLCDACRTYAWHGAEQRPIRGHHPACPSLCANPWTDAARTEGFAVGPDSTRAYMKRVKAQYDAFNRDVQTEWHTHLSKPRLAPDYWVAWNQQYLAWTTFYQDNIDSTTLGWTAAEYDETEKYEEALRGFREKFRQYTGQAPSSPDPPRPPSGENPLRDVATILKWGVIGYLALQAASLVRSR